MQNVDSLFLKIPSCTYGTIPLVLHGKTNCTTQPDKRKVNQLNKLQLDYLHKSIQNNFNAVACRYRYLYYKNFFLKKNSKF